MTRRLLTLFTLLAASTAAHASITATVLDENGKPLAGARARAYAREDNASTKRRLLSNDPEAKPVATATSAEDGKLTVDVKGAPVVRLVIDAQGRAVQTVDVSDGDDAGGVVLPASAGQKGHITSGGKGVANALVAIGQWYVTHTDAQGTYDAPALANGSERLVVIHPDYAIADSSVASFEAMRRRNLLDVSLSKGAAISGRVLAADGKTPVAHAIVSVAGWPLAESDANGKYAIAHASQNWRAVYAQAPQLAGVASKKAAPSVDIKLGPAATLTGAVKSKTGVVAGAFVSLFNELDAGGAPSAVTDAKGRFAFDGLVPGHYTLFGNHPDFTITRLVADVPSSEKVLAAEELVRLRGTVVDEGKKPVAGARVSVSSLTGSGSISRGPAAISSSNGQFVARVGEGSVQFVASHRGYAAGIVGPLPLDKARDVTITLPAGFPMKFKVVDAQRTPIAGVMIDIMRAGEVDRRAPLPCSDAKDDCHTSAADGTVEERLVEGKYDLVVSGEEIAQKRLSGQALTARTSPMTITVDRGVEVSGRVALSDGTPVAGAVINARGSTSRGATSAADGTFTLKGLAAGPVAISATTPNTTPPMQSMPVAVTAPAKNVLLRIPTPTTLSGRVLEKTSGTPITDFQIVVIVGEFGAGRPGSPSPVHSDDGSFSIPVVPGRGELRVTAPGYVRASLTGLTIEEGKPLTGLEVRMDRGGRIVGRVTSNGQPVAQAYVSASSGDRMSGGQAGAQTDANGEYTIDGVDAGDRTITARKQGLLSADKEVTAKAGEEVRADLELGTGREVKGRVLDRGGRPIEGARIQINGVEDRSIHANGASDADGNFKIGGIGDGHLTLRAEKQGYVAAALDDVDTLSNIILTLDRGGSISGRVVGLSDAETGIVSISASYGASAAHATVDTDGSFTVRGVPDGVVSVSAMKTGAQMRHSAPKQVTVSNGTAPFIEIDFSEGISVRGRVTREGKPVMGGSIGFTGMKGEQGGNSPIAPDGTYQVNGLQVGDYRVYVVLYGVSGASMSERLAVTGSMTHDVDLTGGALRGRVIDAETGQPLADATLLLRSTTADGVGSRQATTDSAGHFSFDLLQDGSYHLGTQRSQYAAKQQDVSVPGPDVEIALTRTSATIVHVVDSVTGLPLTADISAANDQKAPMGNARTGSDGTASLYLPAGSYRFFTHAAGYINGTTDVTVPGPEVRVSLQRGGTITFRLHGPETTYRVRLLVNGAAQRTDYLNAPARMSLTGIAPGTYTAEVTGADGKTPHGAYPVTVLPGQTAYVDVTQ